MSDEHGEQTYSRRNLMLYLAIMEGASVEVATRGLDALMARPEMKARLREEITWAQFQEEAPELKELLS